MLMKVNPVQARCVVASQLGPDFWRCSEFGAGKFSQTFLVEGPRGQYVLRVTPSDSLLQLFYERRMMRQEPAIHEKLREKTSVPVPQIVAYDFSRKLIDRDYLIMPLLPGKPLSNASLGNTDRRRAFFEWGTYVAQIHSVTDPANRFGYLGVHKCMDPQTTWREAFVVMYRKELEDIVSCDIYDQATFNSAMLLLEKNLEAFDHCDTSNLLHGDLWLTNLLVEHDGKVTGVLDFDRACWGDIEWDLAIAEYCGVTREAFWEGYGRIVDTHSGAAAVRRMFYLLYEHQKYIVISMSTRRNDPVGARRYAKESLAVMDRFRRTGRAEF